MLFRFFSIYENIIQYFIWQISWLSTTSSKNKNLFLICQLMFPLPATTFSKREKTLKAMKMILVIHLRKMKFRRKSLIQSPQKFLILSSRGQLSKLVGNSQIWKLDVHSELKTQSSSRKLYRKVWLTCNYRLWLQHLTHTIKLQRGSGFQLAFIRQVQNIWQSVQLFQILLCLKWAAEIIKSSKTPTKSRLWLEIQYLLQCRMIVSGWLLAMNVEVLGCGIYQVLV